jgi:hypothetical protein
MSYKITSALKGIEALCDTNYGVDYFNTLFKTTDCVVGEYTPPPPVDTLIDDLRAKIKVIRAASLEKFPRNSGVATVYELNFQAAVLGAGDSTTVLRNGKTPAQHLGDFGVHLGMTAGQFASYVLAENLSAGQKMSEVEAEYLRLYYDGPPTAQTVVDYQAYCDARTAGY